MNHIRLLFRPYQLPLRTPWPGVSPALEARTGWILQMQRGTIRGFGECAPLSAAGTETAEAAGQALAGLARRGFREGELRMLADELSHATPALACALETALLDLESREQGIPLRRRLASRPADSFRVNSVAGTACHNHALTDCRQGFGVVKLKLGRQDWQTEARCLAALALELPPGVKLRLDANGAWLPSQAREFLRAVASLPIDCLEEPLARPGIDELAALQDETPVPLAVDESFHRLGREKVVESAPVRRLVLKPMALGGLSTTLEYARRALAGGMTPILTSTLESAVGLHALCQLAAVLESLAPGGHHGLATSNWFGTDLASPPRTEEGRIHLDQRPGIGVTP